jgi:hypothetical protein
MHDQKPMNALTDYLRDHKPQQFKAVPIYSPEGDSLTFIFEDTQFYRQRIDNFLTVYRAMDSREGGKVGRLVGCQLKGVPTMLKSVGSFGVTITNHPIKLFMVFHLYMATADQQVQHFYLDLANRIEAKTAEIRRDQLMAA